MKVYQERVVLFFLLAIFANCGEQSEILVVQKDIYNVFKETESVDLSIEKDELTIKVSDSDINVIQSYLENKSNYLVFLLGKEFTDRGARVKLAVRDSVIYSRNYDVEEFRNTVEKYELNKRYSYLSKSIFQNFDETEFWNMETALSTLGELESNKNLGFSSVFDMLYKMTDDDLTFEERRNTGVLLAEGFKLINTAGMVSFWDHSQYLETAGLVKDLNEIFNYLEFKEVSGDDSLLIVNKKHVINFE